MSSSSHMSLTRILTVGRYLPNILIKLEKQDILRGLP